MKKFTAFALAALMLLTTLQPAFAAWENTVTEWAPDGTPLSGVLTFTNGGEKFDPAALTWGTVSDWKINAINAQSLTPRTTGFERLDKLVEARLATLITPGMTNFQKLRAVYDDIVRNSSYSIPIYGGSYSSLDPWTKNPPKTYLMSYTHACYGAYLLETGAGVCDEFSAAFVAMANALGFEAYQMSGQIRGNGHSWSMLRIGERYYIFDAQAEQVNIKSNHVRYVNFMIDVDATDAYAPYEGCFTEQIGYRSSGSIIKTSVIGSDAEARQIRDRLIAYGEALDLDYRADMNSVVYNSQVASAYASIDALMAEFQDSLDTLIGYTKKNGRWWHDDPRYYVDDRSNIRLVDGDGICGKVDDRGRPSGGYLAFGLTVEPVDAALGDYVITIYRS